MKTAGSQGRKLYGFVRIGPEDVHQRLVLVVLELTCIKEHTVFLAAFNPDMGLIRVRARMHSLATTGAIDIVFQVPVASHGAIPTIQDFTPGYKLELLELAGIEPDSLTVSTAVYRDASMIDLLHAAGALGTLNAVHFLVIYHFGGSSLS